MVVGQGCKYCVCGMCMCEEDIHCAVEIDVVDREIDMFVAKLFKLGQVS